MIDENKVRGALQKNYIPWFRVHYPDKDAGKEVDKVIEWLKCGPHFSANYWEKK